MPKPKIKALLEQIQSLESDKTTLESRVEQLNAELSNQKANFETEKNNLNSENHNKLDEKQNAHNSEVSELNNKIGELETDVKNKQKQLNDKELKKLARAYSDQEDHYELKSDRWLWLVTLAFVAAGVGTIWIIHFSGGEVWHTKIGYYFADVLLITFLVFSLKQYSYYVKLKSDYANRKTLAQSYNNILNTEEDIVIRSKFLESAVSVLAAPAEVKNESYTIPEKLLESITEIAKNLSKIKSP